MQAADIMTKVVYSVATDTTVADVAKTMLDNGVSAVPVVDGTGSIVGIISEGDLVRRVEANTERRPSRWLQLVSSNVELAREYVKSRGRLAAEIMTRNVATVTETTPVRDIVDMMEAKRLKRVPVVHDGAVVGMVSRADLLRALRAGARFEARNPGGDRAIRETLLAELRGQKWADAAGLNVIVSDGVVHLWGVATSPDERAALRVAAENVPGVASVEDHLVLLPALPPI
jgi:CBS domain-containing protein